MRRLLALAAALSLAAIACNDIALYDGPEREGDDPGECEDGADNDFDGAYDCDDSDCAGAPACADDDDAADDDDSGDDDDAADDDDATDDDDDDIVLDDDDIAPDDDDIAPDDDDSADDDDDIAPDDDDIVLDDDDVVPDDDDSADDDDDTADDDDDDIAPDDDDVTPPPSTCPDGNCALRFDGSDDYLTVPHDPSLTTPSTGLTVEAWVYYDQIASGCMTVARKGISGSAVQEYWLHKNISPADSTHWAGWGSWTVSSFSSVGPGTWIHYAGVYDPSTNQARTYFNGAFHTSSAANAPPSDTGELMYIGIDWDLGCPMDGVIDELRISSVPRYSSNFSPALAHVPDADTMALYHFDEYSGSTAWDVSGNGNHATLVGPTWTTESP